MRKATVSIGLIAASLGALWLLQGLGIVHLRPVLCFVDCAPIQAPSATWAVIGAVMFTAGGTAVWWSLKRRAA